jgi:hypothetical protein
VTARSIAFGPDDLFALSREWGRGALDVRAKVSAGLNFDETLPFCHRPEFGRAFLGENIPISEMKLFGPS